MKKLSAVAIAILCGATVFSGCQSNGNNGASSIDPNKKQIYIAIGDNGVGTEFLYNLKAEYEKLHSDREIVIKLRDSELNNGASYLQSATEDIVYFSGSLTYSDYGKYLYDMTNVMTKKLYNDDGDYVGAVSSDNGALQYTENGTKALSDRMTNYQSNYNLFNQGTTASPSFLSIPWFSAVFGLWYDVDMFDAYDLYDLPGYKGLDKIEGTEDDNYGVDGVAGTYADGLPATFEDLKVLLTEMENKGYKPFTFSGQYSWMRNSFLDSVCMNYEGADDYALNYTFDGVDSDFGKIDATNGYLLKQQEGRKASLKFAELIAKNNYYSSGSLNTVQDHKTAQKEYLTSAVKSPRSGLLIDGNWWEYEAKDYFDLMAKQNKKFAYGTRKFAYFPVPRFIGTEGIKDQTNQITYLNDYSEYEIVGIKSTKVPELVEDFLLFANSAKNHIKFTQQTGLFVPFDYEMTEEEMQGLTYMSKNLYSVLHADNVKTYFSSANSIVNTEGKTYKDVENCVFNLNQAFFDLWETATTIGDKNYYDPIRDMAYGENNINANSWFNGYATMMTKEKWDSAKLKLPSNK